MKTFPRSIITTKLKFPEPSSGLKVTGAVITTAAPGEDTSTGLPDGEVTTSTPNSFADILAGVRDVTIALVAAAAAANVNLPFFGSGMHYGMKNFCKNSAKSHTMLWEIRDEYNL